MSLENIAAICIAIDTAILGIAYPIIIDKISNTQLYTLMYQSKNKLILYYQLQGNNKTDLFCG